MASSRAAAENTTSTRWAVSMTRKANTRTMVVATMPCETGSLVDAKFSAAPPVNNSREASTTDLRLGLGPRNRGMITRAGVLAQACPEPSSGPLYSREGFRLISQESRDASPVPGPAAPAGGPGSAAGPGPRSPVRHPPGTGRSPAVLAGPPAGIPASGPDAAVRGRHVGDPDAGVQRGPHLPRHGLAHHLRGPAPDHLCVLRPRSGAGGRADRPGRVESGGAVPGGPYHHQGRRGGGRADGGAVGGQDRESTRLN